MCKKQITYFYVAHFETQTLNIFLTARHVDMNIAYTNDELIIILIMSIIGLYKQQVNSQCKTF